MHEILADSIVEANIDLTEPSQVEGAELSKDKCGEQLDGKVTQRYTHFVLMLSDLEHERFCHMKIARFISTAYQKE